MSEFNQTGGWDIVRVYVMGPYTQGEVGTNVARAIEAADRLFKLGYYPYLPHLTHFWHLHLQHEYEDWIRLDTSWLMKCDVALRLPGESPGADSEEAMCKRFNIQVFYDEEELVRCRPPTTSNSL
jgi:hypothetical protein